MGPAGAGRLTLLEHAELWLERGEHVSLVGPNGTGKTTLIETLAGRRELAAGKLSTGHNVTVGYLSQHAEELGAGGPAEQSVLDAAQRATGLSPNKARALLGRFLFSGEEAEKPLAGLSGGERRRLSLAVLVGAANPPNVLILDEPTNHLDIESREALEDALRAFKGAILLVSHDRALLDAVGTRTVAVRRARCTATSAAGRSTCAPAKSARADGVALGDDARRPPCSRRRPAANGAHATSATNGASKRTRGKSKRGGGRRRTASATRRRPSRPSKPPRRRCARSRTSSPTRRRGRAATSRRSPRRATRPPGARSRTPTRACRRSSTDSGDRRVRAGARGRAEALRA